MAVRPRNSRRWVWFLVLLLGCVLAGVQSHSGSTGREALPNDLASRLTRPFRGLLTSIGNGLGRGGQFFRHVFELERENRELKEQLERARTEPERVAEWEREVQRLRQLLAMRDRLAEPAIAARVIGRSPSPWFQTLDLETGSRDGVRAGCAVVGPSGLVGQVYRVARTSSKVLCLTDRQGSVGARLQPDRVRDVLGVCRGEGQELLTMTCPNPTAQVRPGDAVMTSGHEHGSRFPAGLLIGHVLSVQPRPHESCLVLTVRPASELGRVEEVLVLLTAEESTATDSGPQP